MQMKFTGGVYAFTRAAVAACVLFGLVACGVPNPVVETLRYALPGGRQFAELRAGQAYLVVELEGRASVMALGSRRVEGTPPFEDVTEYWYNGQGEMLVLKNGRIHLAIGMAQEWRSNVSQPPRWREAFTPGGVHTWGRQLDRMPGYRFGSQDEIATGPIERPSNTPDGVSADAQWVGDVVQSHTRYARPWQYTQRFAVLNDRVVYSEQCVSEAVCLKLRHLGAVEQP